MVIFGAWDRYTNGRSSLILSEDWRIKGDGKKASGYDQSRQHARLVEDDGYKLMTFPMVYSKKKQDGDGVGPATIGGFIPDLTEKKIARVSGNWYALDPDAQNPLAEELASLEKYPEGAKFQVTINSYERNSKARAACISHHGLSCKTCGFNFVAFYGAMGVGFIHVHHTVPIGSIGQEYEVDPIKDLIPVCPNCHAMIHRSEPALSVEQLREHLRPKTQA